MERVLCILSGMNAGGAETFLMKIYRNIDRKNYQMDFCINEKETCFYEREILELGGKIHRIPTKSENLQEFRRQLTSVIQENKYKNVFNPLLSISLIEKGRKISLSIWCSCFKYRSASSKTILQSSFSIFFIIVFQRDSRGM